jgi:hypothetical protein
MKKNKGMLDMLVKLEREYRKVGKVKDANAVLEHIQIVKDKQEGK